MTLERFKKPTDEEIVVMAIAFNNDSLEPKQKIIDMVGMCLLVIDRLYENGDIKYPSKKETN